MRNQPPRLDVWIVVASTDPMLSPTLLEPEHGEVFWIALRRWIAETPKAAEALRQP